ncbi:MAG: DUF4435 domain-containing protein, partial [Vulcanimicrobiaceae bacterium]
RLFRPSDHAEVSTAFDRLGTSHFESLLYKGTIFVEGETDVTILEAGFGDYFHRYNLRSMGGRSEIEREIGVLQKAEAAGGFIGNNYFIFDLDRKPAHLNDSEHVRLLQWDRYCIENYLIDQDVLWVLLSSGECSAETFRSREELQRSLRDMAMAQLDDTIAKTVYQETGFRDVQMRSADVEGHDLPEIAAIQFRRLEACRKQLDMVTREWQGDFIARCNKRKAGMLGEWEANWPVLCNGKRLLRDLHRSRPMNLSQEKFMRRIMERLRSDKRPTWRTIEGLLYQLLTPRVLPAVRE